MHRSQQRSPKGAPGYPLAWVHRVPGAANASLLLLSIIAHAFDYRFNAPPSTPSPHHFHLWQIPLLGLRGHSYSLVVRTLRSVSWGVVANRTWSNDGCQQSLRRLCAPVGKRSCSCHDSEDWPLFERKGPRRVWGDLCLPVEVG